MYKGIVCIKNIKGTEDIFTNSKIIANGTENKPRAIRQLIRKYENELKQFGHLDISNVGVRGTSSYEEYYKSRIRKRNLL